MLQGSSIRLTKNNHQTVTETMLEDSRLTRTQVLLEYSFLLLMFLISFLVLTSQLHKERRHLDFVQWGLQCRLTHRVDLFEGGELTRHKSINKKRLPLRCKGSVSHFYCLSFFREQWLTNRFLRISPMYSVQHSELCHENLRRCFLDQARSTHDLAFRCVL